MLLKKIYALTERVETLENLVNILSSNNSALNTRLACIAEDMQTPKGWFRLAGKIHSGLSAKKGTGEFQDALKEAGDILITSGMDAKRLEAILKRGYREEITNEIEKAARTFAARTSKAQAPVSSVVGAQVVNEPVEHE